MKKILIVVLILALSLGVLAGCSDKEAEMPETPQDLFDKVTEASQDIVNAEFKADLDLEISGLEALGFAGPMGLEMSGKMQDAKTMMLDLALDTGQGMTVEAELFLNEEKMLIHAPLLQMVMGYAYVEMDMEAVAEMSGTSFEAAADSEKVLAILDRFEEETEYSIYDMIIFEDAMDKVEVTVNDEKIDATKLLMTINLDNSVDMLMAFMTFISEDEEAKELFFASYTQEDIDMMMEEMKDPETKAEIDKALEAVSINTFEFACYVNDEFLPVKYDMNIDITVDAEGQETTVKLTGTFDLFNFDGVKDIEFPEVDSTEVMNLNDMLN